MHWSLAAALTSPALPSAACPPLEQRKRQAPVQLNPQRVRQLKWDLKAKQLRSPEAGTETSTASETSTESAPASEESIGTILGSHLGKLIGQGLADLFR